LRYCKGGTAKLFELQMPNFGPNLGQISGHVWPISVPCLGKFRNYWYGTGSPCQERHVHPSSPCHPWLCRASGVCHSNTYIVSCHAVMCTWFAWGAEGGFLRVICVPFVASAQVGGVGLAGKAFQLDRTTSLIQVYHTDANFLC